MITRHACLLLTATVLLGLQLCAPREAVVQQAWREVEDGTIILLGSSTEHSSVPLKKGAWSWFAPVRAKARPLAPLSAGSLGLSANCQTIHSAPPSHPVSPKP